MVEAGEVFEATQEYLKHGTGEHIGTHMKTSFRAHMLWKDALRWELPPGAYGENAGPN